MRIVDAHCHASVRWYEPVETLLFQMDRAGVEKAMVTQLLGHYDNDELLETCVKRSDRLGAVVGVDPASPDAADMLRGAADAGAIGVRIGATVTNDALWQAAADAGIAVSVSGVAKFMVAPDFAARIEQLPKLPFVLEHLGGIGRPDFDGSDETRAAVLGLSRFANVVLKVPGLGQLGKRIALVSDPPIEAGAVTTLRTALAHFGADRLMWGSDFPPVASREGYANALCWPQRALADSPEADRAALFGGTAMRIFKL